MPNSKLPKVDLDRLPVLGRIATGVSPDPGNLTVDEKVWVEHFKEAVKANPGLALDFPVD